MLTLVTLTFFMTLALSKAEFFAISDLKLLCARLHLSSVLYIYTLIHAKIFRRTASIISSEWRNQSCQLQTIRGIRSLNSIGYVQTFNTYFGYFPYTSKTVTLRDHINYSWFQCCVYNLIFRHDSTVMIRSRGYQAVQYFTLNILQESKHTIWKLL